MMYMRGDSVEKGLMRELIDSYLHTYYENTEDLYRENIYRLGIWDLLPLLLHI